MHVDVRNGLRVRMHRCHCLQKSRERGNAQSWSSRVVSWALTPEGYASLQCTIAKGLQVRGCSPALSTPSVHGQAASRRSGVFAEPSATVDVLTLRKVHHHIHAPAQDDLFVPDGISLSDHVSGGLSPTSMTRWRHRQRRRRCRRSTSLPLTDPADAGSYWDHSQRDIPTSGITGKQTPVLASPALPSLSFRIEAQV